jgi:two-component system, OmpR family, alkaline phosphatase synthesis response regulator PhoP
MTKIGKKKILVVESNPEVCAAVEAFVQSLGYAALGIHSLEGIEEKLYDFKPDFLILEKQLELAGPSVISKIRSSELFRLMPILVLTQSEDYKLKQTILMMGADSFLQKPIQFEELGLKIQALFRRSLSYQASIEEVFYKNLKLSPLSGEVFIDSQRVNFTATEFKLLETLIVEKGRPVRRESLAHKGLNSPNTSLRTIDVHINSIRGKLGPIGRQIKTLRGRGYMLID